MLGIRCGTHLHHYPPPPPPPLPLNSSCLQLQWSYLSLTWQVSCDQIHYQRRRHVHVCLHLLPFLLLAEGVWWVWRVYGGCGRCMMGVAGMWWVWQVHDGCGRYVVIPCKVHLFQHVATYTTAAQVPSVIHTPTSPPKHGKTDVTKYQHHLRS